MWIHLLHFCCFIKILGVEFEYTLGESFYNDKMTAVVELLKKKGLLEESEGAYVVRLDEYELPPCIILKSNGSTIYATRDLATAIYRHDQLHGEDLVYVVGGEQTLHFKQVFAVLEKMGYQWAKHCRHIPFGLMRLEGKKVFVNISINFIKVTALSWITLRK
ncbi:arginine--tRNA ligase [Bacillaceae bacterium Marseille-Q3522]|nr:arginine--tRNA ligase [Bacillaceae bacterium Marseille-Q3522]